MKKSILISTTLLILNLTALYGQTGDSVTCYTKSELKRIAGKLVYANECYSLYQIAEKQITVKDSIIALKNKDIILQDSTIVSYKDIVTYKDSIISVNKKQLKQVTTDLEETQSKLKLTKIGWVSSLVATVLLMLL